VTHVLLHRERGAPVRFLDKTATVQAIGRGLRLYTLHQPAAGNQP
jgi:hypothetical protein